MSEFQDFLENVLKDITLTEEKESVINYEYDLNKDIQELILSTRLDYGLTQKQLSEKTGLSQANISRIENGQALPNLGTLEKIADSFGKRLVISFEDFNEENFDGNLY